MAWSYAYSFKNKLQKDEWNLLLVDMPLFAISIYAPTAPRPNRQLNFEETQELTQMLKVMGSIKMCTSNFNANACTSKESACVTSYFQLQYTKPFPQYTCRQQSDLQEHKKGGTGTKNTVTANWFPA